MPLVLGSTLCANSPWFNGFLCSIVRREGVRDCFSRGRYLLLRLQWFFTAHGRISRVDILRSRGLWRASHLQVCDCSRTWIILRASGQRMLAAVLAIELKQRHASLQLPVFARRKAECFEYSTPLRVAGFVSHSNRFSRFFCDSQPRACLLVCRGGVAGEREPAWRAKPEPEKPARPDPVRTGATTALADRTLVW